MYFTPRARVRDSFVPQNDWPFILYIILRNILCTLYIRVNASIHRGKMCILCCGNDVR